MAWCNRGIVVNFGMVENMIYVSMTEEYKQELAIFGGLLSSETQNM